MSCPMSNFTEPEFKIEAGLIYRNNCLGGFLDILMVFFFGVNVQEKLRGCVNMNRGWKGPRPKDLVQTLCYCTMT